MISVYSKKDAKMRLWRVETMLLNYINALSICVACNDRINYQSTVE